MLGHAQETLITDRPDFTESAQTIAPGRVQVESGFTVTRTGNAHEAGFGEVLVRVPAGKKAEIRVGVPSYLVVRDGGRATGFDDAFLGAKFRLTHPEKRTAIAILAGASLPTGSRRVAEHKVGPEAVLAVEFPSRGRWELATNVGYGRPTNSGQRFSQVFGSLTTGTDLSSRLGLFLEGYAFNRDAPGGSTKKYLDAGLTYLCNNDLQFDALAGIGVNNHEGGPDYFYGAGVARRF